MVPLLNIVLNLVLLTILKEKVFLEIKEKLEKNKSKYGVNKIESFYMSVLEHEWIIIFEAVDAHDIESLCIDAGIASFNTIKIVALKKYEDIQHKVTK